MYTISSESHTKLKYRLLTCFQIKLEPSEKEIFPTRQWFWVCLQIWALPSVPPWTPLGPGILPAAQAPPPEPPADRRLSVRSEGSRSHSCGLASCARSMCRIGHAGTTLAWAVPGLLLYLPSTVPKRPLPCAGQPQWQSQCPRPPV